MKNKSFILLTLTFAFAISDTLSYTFSADDNTTLCNQFFKNLANSSYVASNASAEIYNFLLYSGHNVNDLGYYKNCRDLPTQKYSILQASLFQIGLCGPAYCSLSLLQNYTDNILAFLSKLTKKDLSQAGVRFVDPDETGIEQGFLFYFTIILYAALFGMVIAGTISANFKRRDKSSKESKLAKDPQEGLLREALLINKDSSNDTVIITSNRANFENPTQKFSPPQTPLYIKVIECFDIASNFEALFKYEEVQGHDQNLNVFNGIRTLAFGWVVYGHTILASLGAKNILYLQLYLKSSWALILIAAYFAVDTFFYLSGFFTAFIMVSKLKKMRFTLKNYLWLLFHRFLRLWPSYFVAMLFYWKMSVNFGSGPLWPTYVASAQICDGGAWKNLLFLDNVLNTSADYCFGWGWYLSNDFQMFLMAPFICWIYIKNKSLGLKTIWILIVISVMASYAFLADNGDIYILMGDTNSNNAGDNFMEYYVNTIVRMAPYLFGLWMGFMFREYKEGKANFFSWIKEDHKRSIICSFAGFAIFIFIVFFPRMLQTGGTWSNGFGETWDATTRTIWVVGVFLLTAPCLVGNLPSLRSIMSNYYFTVVARVSYTGYLIHYVFLDIIYGNVDQSYGVSQSTAAARAFGIMMIAIVGGIVIHLFVEKPVINIETKILNPRKPRENSQDIKNSNKIEA